MTDCAKCGKKGLGWNEKYKIYKLAERDRRKEYVLDEKGKKITIEVCKDCFEKAKQEDKEASEKAQQAQKDAYLIFKEDMTDEQLKESNTEHMRALAEWESKSGVGITAGGAIAGLMSGNVTALTVNIVTLLQGIMAQNKIMIRQNELLLRKLENLGKP